MIQKYNLLKVEGIESVYHMTDENNVSLIVKHGLLSRNLMNKAKIRFNDISDQGIQQRRESKRLHDYASTYLNPRNAMLYRILKEGKKVVIIEFDTDFVMEKRPEDVFISNLNAAKNNAGIEMLSNVRIKEFLDMDKVFARSWHDSTDDEIKGVMQSEILVRNIIEPKWIKRIIVENYDQKTRIINLTGLNPEKIYVDESEEFFFRGMVV
ncbi:DUF4433 domain-containing protein [Athalassotoga saccharophila]|uniref:DUF4433 domain-containing protein n=1 Tax=Athalassotoga saccharophila TaxID=1441386 RepID=UPI001E6590BB|nr:DUF4433 domain-containing protein [Athalassotoga saccharophila]